MIKTTQSSAVMAYNIINKLSSGSMPISMAYKFFKVKQALKPSYDFQVEQEQALFDELHPEYVDNSWRFNNEEDRNAFAMKLNEIHEMPVEIDIDKQYVALDDHIVMSIEEMEILDIFIGFDEQDANQ